VDGIPFAARHQRRLGCANTGFPTHPHRDMEIITYVLEGKLEHKGSLGTGSVIQPGDGQRMTAGSGILHSEFNPSKTQPVHLLQIWILPEKEALPRAMSRRPSRKKTSAGSCG
jgi:redox-sensitive bicupin YhaK (pirin superfamily)